VVLGPRRDRSGLRALTGNFIEVTLPAGSAERGDLVEVVLESAGASATRARVAGTPAWVSQG